MSGYVKLFSSIVHSTVWREEMHVKVVWITMLALSDRHGCVMASIPGLADAARVSRKECDSALARLSAPDPDSRTKDHDGARIAEIDGGWQILNYYKFRQAKDEEEERIKTRERVARHRAKKAAESTKSVTVTPSNAEKRDDTSATPSTPTPTPAPTPEATETETTPPAPTAPSSASSSARAREGVVGLGLFVQAFNAAYGRKVSVPVLNGSASKHLRELVRVYGEDGAACLPLMAYMRDVNQDNSDQRCRTRAVTDLLHDGERGTFQWSKLLTEIDRFRGRFRGSDHVWEVADRLGLAAALERLGASRESERTLLRAVAP